VLAGLPQGTGKAMSSTRAALRAAARLVRIGDREADSAGHRVASPSVTVNRRTGSARADHRSIGRDTIAAVGLHLIVPWPMSITPCTVAPSQRPPLIWSRSRIRARDKVKLTLLITVPSGTLLLVRLPHSVQVVEVMVSVPVAASAGTPSLSTL